MKKTLLTMSAFAILSIQGFANPWIECGIGAMLFQTPRWCSYLKCYLGLGSTATTSAMSSPEPVKDDQLRPPCLSTKPTLH